MYQRLCKPLKDMSFFLFGARGTGKTWLLRELLNEETEILLKLNLLNESTYLEYLTKPEKLKNYLKILPDKKWIVIDEVQRIPSLLNVVHDILESPDYHGKIFFALTGSSARKLKRGGANLLAGRALVYNIYPFSYFEVNSSGREDFNLLQMLNWGSLPYVVTASSDVLRKEILTAYVGTYLKEEIKEEQIVRQIEPFARFLESAAQANTTIIQYSNIANAAQVDQKAVARYFEILEDTLIGYFLEPYSLSTRERTVAKAKFYFFDLGVCRALSRSLDIAISPGTYAWGKAFEHFFISEVLKLNSYYRTNLRFSYLRTKDDAEIDLIVERPGSSTLCIEIKSGKEVTEKEVNKLLNISSSIKNSKPMMVYDGKEELLINNVRIVNWKEALKEIFKIN